MVIMPIRYSMFGQKVLCGSRCTSCVGNFVAFCLDNIDRIFCLQLVKIFPQAIGTLLSSSFIERTLIFVIAEKRKSHIHNTIASFIKLLVK